ncbi:MAG: hypothetical protein ACTSW3_08815 [Promethearchaeota archaeon]
MRIIPIDALWIKFLNEFRTDLISSYKKEELIATDKIFKTFAEICKNSDLFLIEVKVDFLDEVKEKAQEIQKKPELEAKPDETEKPEEQAQTEVSNEPEIIEKNNTDDVDDDLKEILGE